MKRILFIIFTIMMWATLAFGGTHRVYTNTSATAIAVSYTAFDSVVIKQVVVHFSTAPTTSENIVFTLDSNAGAAYDTVVYTGDPSASAVTSLVWVPADGALVLVYGDELDIEYTNTDTRTIGISVYYEVGR